MKEVSNEIIQFFEKQGAIVVSTIDKDGYPHNSCKGIVKINKSGTIYLLDLYRRKTYDNLRKNPSISITAVDDHRFMGFCLKGKAKIIKGDKLTTNIIKAWEKKINSRIIHRIIKNIHGEKGKHRHPEVLLPKPEYLIVMKVEKVIDLTPQHIKQGIY